MAQFHDSPARYLAVMRAALPLYDRLQEEIAQAGEDLPVARMLDLGAGTGETARRCLEHHPDAELVVTDASQAMLERAAGALGPRAQLRLARLEDPLPPGPFDLVVSALAVHHLGGPGKADLFRRVRERLAPGGRFVMGDVVASAAPVTRPTPLDPAVDRPDRIADLLQWLAEAELAASLTWSEQDLAVIVGVAR